MMVYHALAGRFHLQSYHETLGIYSTLEKAKAACEKDARQPLRWNGPKDGWEWWPDGGSHRIRGVEVE